MLYVESEGGEQARVLLDVNALDPSGLLALAWYEPSPDGRYVAFGTYRPGDKQAVAQILETASEWLADEIDGRVGAVDWLDDGRQFVVRRLSEPANPYSGQITLAPRRPPPESRSGPPRLHSVSPHLFYAG